MPLATPVSKTALIAHWWGLAQAAALSTLLNIGAELATDESDGVATALRDGAQQTIGSAGEEIVC